MSSTLATRLRWRLARRRIRAYEAIEGFLTEREAVQLYRLAKGVPREGCVVEIGTWKGKSTYCLARGLRSGRLNTIDPFDASGDAPSKTTYSQTRGPESLEDQFLRRMAELGVQERIRSCKGFSRDFAGQFPRIDLLFIDGDHSIEACDFDYRTFAPALVPAGVLAFHDFYADRPELGPTWVVQNRVLPSSEYEHVALVDSLWIARKR